MIYYGIVTKENINKHNLNQPRILHLLYRILIIESSVSGKKSIDLSDKKVHDDGYSIVDEINLYVKNSNEVNNI